MGVCLMDVYHVHLTGRAPHGYVPHGRVPRERVLH
jgi:hypothetical protein